MSAESVSGTCGFVRKTGNEKGPRQRRGPFENLPPLLDAGATGDEAFGVRGGCRQLNGERNLTLVAQNAQLHGAILIFALRREFFAKLAGGTDAIAVERDDDIACLHAGLFRRRTGVDVANEYSLAVGSAEKCAELSA
jgi:hypothetical protein